MNSELIVAIIGGLAVLGAAIVGAPRLNRDKLAPIQKQLEIFHSLPESSPARAEMLKRIEDGVASLNSEDVARRDPSGIAVSVFLLIVGGAAGWLVLSLGDLFWLLSPLAVFALILALVGLAQSSPRVPRAANGQTMKALEEKRLKQEQRTNAARSQDGHS